MTPQQAEEIRRRAMRQIDNGLVSIHITARQVEDLACAYLNALTDHRAHGDAMVALIDGAPSTDDSPARVGALQHWAENGRAKLRALLYEIRGLAKTRP